MGERKVQNKYYPPDFDPAKIPTGKREKSHKVRMMMPMSVQCNECNGFIYQGKKFNALIERVQGEDYLGIAIYRLGIRCPDCSHNFTIRTDPAKSDYMVEMGARRLKEAWKVSELDEEEKERQREESRADIMKDLDEQAGAAQKEMDDIDSLNRLKAFRLEQGEVTEEQIMEAFQERRKAKDEAARFDGVVLDAKESAAASKDFREAKRELENKKAASKVESFGIFSMAPAAPAETPTPEGKEDDEVSVSSMASCTSEMSTDSTISTASGIVLKKKKKKKKATTPAAP